MMTTQTLIRREKIAIRSISINKKKKANQLCSATFFYFKFFWKRMLLLFYKHVNSQTKSLPGIFNLLCRKEKSLFFHSLVDCGSRNFYMLKIEINSETICTVEKAKYQFRSMKYLIQFLPDCHHLHLIHPECA